MKTAIISMLALVAVTFFGSYHQSVVVPYMVIGAICAVAVLVAQGKIKPEQYPIYIYGMSLALLWQASMLGSHIVGTDIQGEYFIANRALVQGWDWSYIHPFNTSIILGGLAPLLTKIGFPILWQFKALYPAMFASVTVILYFAYQKMVGGRRAFWASLFFMFMSSFFVEIVGIVKSMTAEVFLALMVLFFALRLKTWQKALGVGLSAILASLCHYTIGIAALIYLVGGFLVLLVGKVANKWLWRKVKVTAVASLGCVAIIAVAGSFLWFNNAGSGCMVGVYKEVGVNVVQNLIGYFDFHDEEVEVVTHVGDIIPPSSISGADQGEDIGVSSSNSPANLPATPSPPAKSFYLYEQEPLIRTAVGLDFNEATASGKAFRIMQYLTEFLLLMGAGYLLFRHKKYKFTVEFGVSILMSFFILGLCVFLPGFSSFLNASRFYQISLFFLAPVLVIGVEELGSDIGRGVGWAKGLLGSRM